MKDSIKYYHGLAGGTPFWHQEEVVKESIKQLKFILQLGGIHCRSILETHQISYDKKDSVYNGDDYISVCIENPEDSEFTGENRNLDSAFFRYVRYKIGIEFKPCMVENCTFRERPYQHLPGERQVLSSIDLSNFSRILVGIEGDLEKGALSAVKELCEPYQIPVMTWRGIQYPEFNMKVLQK